MIRVDALESFPITVSLVNEATGTLTSGAIVTYDIRDSLDNALSPSISGTLTESVVTPGIYKNFISIPDSGNYICYASSTGYITNTEDILVSANNVANLVKQTYHHNISVQDIIRTEDTPTVSQVVRNVGMGRTDYVLTKIKESSASDWSGATTSGAVYAWYETTIDMVPYKMGGPS